jgi:glutathione synthase/RimK-type ligase-like ATP-grasp enzyme
MILIVSNPQTDGHIHPVAGELSRRGVEYAVFDPASYPQSSALTVERSVLSTRSHLSWAGKYLSFEEVDAIWYRRPGDFELSPQLRAEERNWLQLECSHVFRGLWESSTAFWVSRPNAIQRASLKILQLDLARALGFAVPHFVLTNEVNVAREFVAAHRHGVIVKVMSNPAIRDGERVGTIYTHLLSERDLDLIDNVRFGPTFLQEFVPKQLDVRVTVIGDEVFAVGIESTRLEEGRVDFRRAEVYDLPHLVIELPSTISRACGELVKRLGLTFGAIDLLQNASGDFVFLEINPNGQWYWLEQVTGVPLTAALCDLLTRRPTGQR